MKFLQSLKNFVRKFSKADQQMGSDIAAPYIAFGEKSMYINPPDVDPHWVNNTFLGANASHDNDFDPEESEESSECAHFWEPFAEWSEPSLIVKLMQKKDTKDYFSITLSGEHDFEGTFFQQQRCRNCGKIITEATRF